MTVTAVTFLDFGMSSPLAEVFVGRRPSPLPPNASLSGGDPIDSKASAVRPCVGIAGCR